MLFVGMIPATTRGYRSQKREGRRGKRLRGATAFAFVEIQHEPIRLRRAKPAFFPTLFSVIVLLSLGYKRAEEHIWHSGISAADHQAQSYARRALMLKTMLAVLIAGVHGDSPDAPQIFTSGRCRG
jgi:hypothetical protein